MSVGFSVWCGLIVGGQLLAVAQDNWGAKMFDRQTVDFGTVAKGADAKQRIKIRNVYQEAIQITSANTSCVCFRASVVDNANTIPSGQTVELEVSCNTLNYQRKRDATLIVSLYEPSKRIATEVRIPLQAYIRTDVVFSPGAINFGNLDLGSGGTQVVKIAYAGRGDWKINEVKSSHGHLSATVKELGRRDSGQGSFLVDYELTAVLKPDAPAGVLRDQLSLITDDANSPQVPLLVHGQVEADITLTPNVLAFGALTPGQSKTMILVVRAKQPITIEKIEREKTDESFRVKLPEDTKIVHTLPITLVTPTEPGDFDELFTITIAGRSEPVTFRAQGKVVPTATPSAN